jgi:hypothetical protein
MKVFNITDVSTPALRNQHLENQPLKVVDTVIMPGKSAEFRGTARERNEASVFLKSGAVAIDELPPAYAAKKGLDVHGRELPKSPAPVVPEEPVEK